MKIRGVFLGLEKVSSKSETIAIPLPDKVVIPMAQCTDEDECSLLVDVGSKVKIGQKIGEGRDGGVPVHSSMSGYVREVRDISLANGTYCKAVVIENDGMQLTENFKVPVINDTDDLISAVRESGCVGLSGEGSSTAKKLESAKGAETLIVNAVECDPMITADHRCMLEDTEDIFTGIEALIRYMHLKKAIIAVSIKDEAAKKMLDQHIKSQDNIAVETVISSYPQGAEKVLVYNLLGKTIKGDSTAAENGVLVLNVSTVAFIGSYLRTGIPLIEKRVTVSGDMIKHPCNLKVPVGTPYSLLLGFTDTNMEAVDKLICGGLMMGQAVESAEIPVCKADNCLLAMIRPEEDSKGKLLEVTKRTHCIRCTRCVSACAMDLMPLKIAKAYKKKDKAALRRLHTELCSECGACTFVCPALQPLTEDIRKAKALLARKESEQ